MLRNKEKAYQGDVGFGKQETGKDKNVGLIFLLD